MSAAKPAAAAQASGEPAAIEEQRRVGRLITFEGPEGGGKTTQIKHLKQQLEHAGIVAVDTHEPGGTVIGQELRAMLLVPERPAPAPAVQALLMSADRAQHVAEVIRPALAAGMVVISDRYLDSTLAYQGFGDGNDLATLETIQRFATGGLTPDLTVLIDLDVRVGLERKRAAFHAGDGEMNRIDRRDPSYHERVRRGYQYLAAREPHRFLVVDGTADIADTSNQIWQRVAQLLCL